MNRLLLAGTLALPFVAAGATSAKANDLPCPHMGCGGFCFKFLGHIHQHGPLYNYGPYTGYYPFEPYGPWNAQLQYTGPYPSNGSCGWNGLGGGVWGGNRVGGRGTYCGVGGCGSWGRYANTTLKNVNWRLFGRVCNKGGGCDGSLAATGTADPAGVASVSAAENPIQTTGYPRTER